MILLILVNMFFANAEFTLDSEEIFGSYKNSNSKSAVIRDAVIEIDPSETLVITFDGQNIYNFELGDHGPGVILDQEVDDRCPSSEINCGFWTHVKVELGSLKNGSKTLPKLIVTVERYFEEDEVSRTDVEELIWSKKLKSNKPLFTYADEGPAEWETLLTACVLSAGKLNNSVCGYLVYEYNYNGNYEEAVLGIQKAASVSLSAPKEDISFSQVNKAFFAPTLKKIKALQAKKVNISDTYVNYGKYDYDKLIETIENMKVYLNENASHFYYKKDGDLYFVLEKEQMIIRMNLTVFPENLK